jgi:unsaturated chondroitin disaccharide hydrolase
MSTRTCIVGVLATVLAVAALAVAALLAPAATAQAADPLDAPVAHDFAFAAHQLDAAAHSIGSTSYPTTTSSTGAWNTSSASDWRSGFFAGALWLMYERTGDPAWKTLAQARTTGLRSQQTDTSSHDVGFKIFTSFGNAYRLTVAPDDTLRQVILTAAGSLARRYSRIVGCVRSWGGLTDSSFQVIIDNMMNLELLLWAAQHGGNGTWQDMAVSHALKTAANHVRTEQSHPGSTYQLVVYDSATGAVKSRGTQQGYSDMSTWSRGQAWAIYGFTMVYRYTHDPRFLATAERTADFFLSHLPADKVPFWDLELPRTTGEPRDSSAAAIAASGLLELSQFESDATRKGTYLDAAKAILTSLSSPAYLAEGTNRASILLHGTQNRPKGDFDSGLIYGDYYFLEALLRYARIAATYTATVTSPVRVGADDISGVTPRSPAPPPPPEPRRQAPATPSPP